MQNYYIERDTYIIEDYDRKPEFSSFLPGLVGVKGIPLWVFYGNRGQGVNSFGVHHKNNAIMEFNPANTAYENTGLKGFRTFIKCNQEYFEPFLTMEESTRRNLYIRKNSFDIEEINTRFGLKIRVKYYCLPTESIGALVRKVTVENMDESPKEIEIIDGLPKIIPYGIENSAYKEMSNLLKSWSDIKNLEENIPFYSMRGSSDDSAEVLEIEGGYFYLSIYNHKVLPVIYDSKIVFGYDSALINPIEFIKQGMTEEALASQCFYNKVPCGFTPQKIKLNGYKVHTFHTMIGYAGAPHQVNDLVTFFCEENYFERKELEAEEVVNLMTQDIQTHTSSTIFDQYVEQCYLDNFLRGGYPFVFNKDSNRSVVHLFSRKHGDPERDYNFFSIAGEYYSQGNGNFRDVNQNRRNDIFFHKDIGDFNVKTFFSLIQIDGYNPLEVRPSTFTVKDSCQKQVDELCKEYVLEKVEIIEKILGCNFTPGEISNGIARYNISLGCEEDEFVSDLLNYCEQHIEAGFGEGYWSDHWDYNMDLLESYLKIFPEKEKELLFEDRSYRFYDSPGLVLPRSEKYVINKKGQVRQYGALIHDEEKLQQAGYRQKGTNWLKDSKGELIETTLIVKLLSLGLNKFTLLDSYGMGIEMEAGKPGWNDAMNGLPGLLGSGMSETFELKRLLEFIFRTIRGKETITIHTEIYHLLQKVASTLMLSIVENWEDFTYWDQVASIREGYRSKVRFTLEGTQEEVSTEEIHQIIHQLLLKVDQGITRACQYGEGIIPTYFTYEVTDFEPVLDDKGKPLMSSYGLGKVKVKAMEVKPLPSFLEGPAKMLGTLADIKEGEKLYQKVKESELYDRQLGMYKTSVPIDHISMENGRIRAFTAGWLERESIFLHMEYKYLLSIQKAGLWERFYEELPHTMVAFRDPAQYGRSILENSSFIASSVNPDKDTHGRGYVARLSGSTTEVISMWIEMFIGSKVFTFENDKLCLHFNPKLAGWLFDEKGEVKFTLLSQAKVTYRNYRKVNTFGIDGVKVKEIFIEDTKQIIQGNCISGDLAVAIRNGDISNIIVTLE